VELKGCFHVVSLRHNQFFTVPATIECVFKIKKQSETESTWYAATSGPIVSTLMIDECGAFSGMIIGRGNRSTRSKPAPVPFYRLHISIHIRENLCSLSLVCYTFSSHVPCRPVEDLAEG
jgi:hypothetical protein